MNAIESNPIAALQPTALAANLMETGAPGELIPYHGALTPRRLDAPEVETGALLLGSAVHDLGWLRRIAVRGEDRFRWLSGMVTNGVETLADRSGAYNLVLNAQGRIQGDACVWHEDDRLELEVTAEQSGALMAHLDRFIIMDDVELIPVEGQSVLGLSGPEAEEILKKSGLLSPAEEMTSAEGLVSGIPVRVYRGYSPLVPRFALWTAVEQIPELWRALLAAGAQAAGAEALEVLRVVEGTPAYGVDIQSRDLAQETSQMRAISFTKGCYLGQEIVERVRSRGQVHRHLRSLELFPEDDASLPQVGTELLQSGATAEAKAAGLLTSVVRLPCTAASRERFFAIGMVRAEAEVGSKPLLFSGGTAILLNSVPKFNL